MCGAILLNQAVSVLVGTGACAGVGASYSESNHDAGN